MYKVFFNERIVILTDDFTSHFRTSYGLYYKYRDQEELEELLDFYVNLKRVDTLSIFHNDIEELRERFKSCFKMIYAAGGLIRNNKGLYLVMKRRGKWDLPKGKVNRNETIENTAIREVTEETGLEGVEITAPLLSTYHSYYIDNKPVLKRTTWFEMLYPGNAAPVPETDEDITEILWMKKDELPGITGNTYLAIIDVLKSAGLL